MEELAIQIALGHELASQPPEKGEGLMAKITASLLLAQITPSTQANGLSQQGPPKQNKEIDMATIKTTVVDSLKKCPIRTQAIPSLYHK